jgi:hypothetical protein
MSSYIYIPIDSLPQPLPHEDVVCYDVRQFDSMYPEHLGKVYDVRLLNRHDGTLHRLLKKLGDDGLLLMELMRQVKVHVKTAKLVGIVDEQVVIQRCLGDSLLARFIVEYRSAMEKLYRLGTESMTRANYQELLQFARALHQIEKSGICVDVAAVQAGDHPFFNRMRPRLNGNLITFKLTPFGGITRRIGAETNSFNPMGIPHGKPREAIVSRFDGGLICAIDYNAMDFRSLIYLAANRNPKAKRLIELYRGCDDFHARTAELVFMDSKERDKLKDMIYPVLYGSRNPDERLAAVLPELFELKIDLQQEAKCFEVVKLPPFSRKVTVTDSKDALALAGQSYSAIIFEKALVRAVDAMKELRSKIIFTVHDEVVIDLHPDEKGIVIDRLLPILEEPMAGLTYKVNVKIGENYGSV